MDRAVELAWKGHPNTNPNPMVGAIFVKDGEIIAEGYHAKYREDHAEIVAIKDAKQDGKSLEGSTLYVTLEPCCHHGKTAPCTQALQKLNLKKVFYAQRDPHHAVDGQGIQQLESAGIQTEPLSTPASERLNEIYLTNITKERSFIHIKTACTLDGKITLKKGTSTHLTNPESDQKAHQLRAQHDAILIGINTLLIDNPKLTVRHVSGPNPIRIVLDSKLQALEHPDLKIFQQSGHTFLATTRNCPKETILPPRTILLRCAKAPGGQIDLHDLLTQIFNQNRPISNILIEGGETVNTSFLNSDLVDRVTLITTPHLANNPKLPSAFQLEDLRLSSPTTERVGTDLWITSPLK